MHSSSKCDKWPSIRQCPLWRQKWIIDIVMIPGTQCPVCLLLLLLLFLLLLLLVCCCLRVQPANQPNPQSQPTQLLLSCRSGSHTSYLLFHYSYCVWLVFIGATKACFKSQHGVFQSKQLKAACDRCDFFPPSWSALRKSQQPLSGERTSRCGLTEECGPGQKYQPLGTKPKLEYSLTYARRALCLCPI